MAIDPSSDDSLIDDALQRVSGGETAAFEVILRRFVTWRYDEGIPLDEMATRCGRSVPAVKKQLWKIRQTLQQCIENRMAAAEE